MIRKYKLASFVWPNHHHFLPNESYQFYMCFIKICLLCLCTAVFPVRAYVLKSFLEPPKLDLCMVESC